MAEKNAAIDFVERYPRLPYKQMMASNLKSQLCIGQAAPAAYGWKCLPCLRWRKHDHHCCPNQPFRTGLTKHAVTSDNSPTKDAPSLSIPLTQKSSSYTTRLQCRPQWRLHSCSRSSQPASASGSSAKVADAPNSRPSSLAFENASSTVRASSCQRIVTSPANSPSPSTTSPM